MLQPARQFLRPPSKQRNNLRNRRIRGYIKLEEFSSVMVSFDQLQMNILDSATGEARVAVYLSSSTRLFFPYQLISLDLLVFVEHVYNFF